MEMELIHGITFFVDHEDAFTHYCGTSHRTFTELMSNPKRVIEDYMATQLK